MIRCTVSIAVVDKYSSTSDLWAMKASGSNTTAKGVHSTVTSPLM